MLRLCRSIPFLGYTMGMFSSRLSADRQAQHDGYDLSIELVTAREQVLTNFNRLVFNCLFDFGSFFNYSILGVGNIG